MLPGGCPNVTRQMAPASTGSIDTSAFMTASSSERRTGSSAAAGVTRGQPPSPRLRRLAEALRAKARGRRSDDERLFVMERFGQAVAKRPRLPAEFSLGSRARADVGDAGDDPEPLDRKST